MQWEELPGVLDDWALKAAAPAGDIRQQAAAVFTSEPCGYYWHADLGRAAVLAAHPGDLARCKAAAAAALGGALVQREALTTPGVGWIKVAYSPVLRRTGELLNFFPGQYPGGVPNSPAPMAAMLTSGLVGAGLGYGTGKLLSLLMPQRFGNRLGRSGALLGALAGASPGALWGLTNRLTGRRFNAPDLTEDGEARTIDPAWANGVDAEIKTGLDRIVLRDDWLAPAAELCKRAYEIFAAPEGAADVSVNALGQTLWDLGASPNLTGATMGALYAARQLPDPRARPGMVTGRQLGQLAAGAGRGYVEGYLTGLALNAVIGTPYRAPAFGLGGAALGVIGTVVPKLFGD